MSNDQSSWNKWLRIFFECAVVLCLSLAVTEVIATVFGYPQNGVQRDPPLHMIPDQTLGWKHKPGHYVFQDDSASPSRAFEVTFGEDGARLSGQFSNTVRPHLVLLGCSFVEGFGLDDSEALGAQLQSRLPMYSIRNNGVAGYGTYQSLLALRKYAEEQKAHQNAVAVYGFADFHSPRNVKTPLIQRTWRGGGIFPVCDESHCYSWEGKSMDGIWRISRSLSLFENAVDTLRARMDSAHAMRVTKRLLLQLKEEARKQSIRLVIAPMNSLGSSWTNFFFQNSFQVAPCFLPELNGREFRLIDGHPNANWIEQYSICLSKVIENLNMPRVIESSGSEPERSRKGHT